MNAEYMKTWILAVLFAGLVSVLGKTQSTSLDVVLTEINYSSDTLKSIFDFVANNLDYDVKMVSKIPEYNSRVEILDAAIRRRKGICEHYAELLHQLMQHHGYDSYLVSGYLKDGERINTEFGHTWNAVRLDEGWYLMDATWASGYVEDMKFYKKYDPQWYLVTPEKMLETHFPYDPLWQLIDNPLSHEDIKSGILIDAKEGNKINYDSIITAEQSMEYPAAVEQSLARIKAAGVTNRLILSRVKFLELELNSANAKNDIDRINKGVDFMNDAVVNFNNYMKAKQQGFRGKEWTAEKKIETTAYIREQLRQATQLFSSVSVKDARVLADLKELKRNTATMMQALEKEIALLEK